MRDDGVATEDDLHVATAQQFRHVAARASVNDSRSQDEENLAVALPRLAHLLRDLVNRQDLRLLGRDVALHKGEGFAVAVALEGLHTDTVMSDDDLLTNAHLMHRFAVGASLLAVHDDRDIHLDILDIDPVPLHAYLRWQVGCRVELVRQHTILLNRHRRRVFGVREDGSELLQFGEHAIEHVAIGRENLQADVAGFRFMSSDVHIFDLEVAAAVHDDIPSARQGPGVDDVAAQFNDFVYCTHFCYSRFIAKR